MKKGEGVIIQSVNRKNEGVIIQSVIRASDILQCFIDNTELGISEISEQMQLSKSTIFGLVNTLKIIGYLEQNQENKKYRLGIKLFELGSLVQNRMDLRMEARAFCLELAEKYENVIHLATHHEGEVIYIDKIESPSIVIGSSRVGKKLPMYCTGVGKAMLAYIGDDYIEKYVLNKPLIQITKNTITSKEKLIEELRVTRARGYAVDDEEIEVGLRCVAAPIFSHDNYPIASISLSASYRKMTLKMIDTIAEDIKYYAKKISERIGHNIKY